MSGSLHKTAYDFEIENDLDANNSAPDQTENCHHHFDV